MIEIIKQSILESKSKSAEEQINKTGEFLQVLMLKILFDRGNLENIAFTGGTALRILYGMRRFSEDMDFSLIKRKGYNFKKLSEGVVYELGKNGFKVESKQKVVSTVNSCLLKFDGLINQLGIAGYSKAKLLIKLEVDTNPPKGGNIVVLPLTDRFVLAVNAFDLPSLFATKIHACFFRKYTKGRDYYDLVWYLGKKVVPNIQLLNNAIIQTEKKDMKIMKTNYKEFLAARVQKVDFIAVRKDVERFLEDKTELKLLNKELILKMLS